MKVFSNIGKYIFYLGLFIELLVLISPKLSEDIGYILMFVFPIFCIVGAVFSLIFCRWKFFFLNILVAISIYSVIAVSNIIWGR